MTIGFFHLYGFIIGCAIIVGAWLFTLKAKQHGIPEHESDILLLYMIGCGLVFARLWHVVTDYQLYVHDWWNAWAVWHGGMSIIGGIMGGVVGIILFQKSHATRSTHTFWKILDVASFALPFAQSIGRLGNYVNHELFGLPTQLPWGIFIPVQYRPDQFLQFNYFHPLFAYEAVPLALFGVWLWWLDRERTWSYVGTGKVSALYLLFYCVLRFLLDFLRAEHQQIFGSLGINQLVVAGGVIISVYILRKSRKVHS